MKKIIGLLMVLSLGLLPQTATSLEQPDQFIFEDNQLTWQAVEFAETYEITVNGQVFERNVPMIELIEEGSYSVSVVARGQGFEDSMAGQTTVDIDYDQDYLFTLNEEANTLFWDAVPQASHYLISYNYAFVKVDQTEFDLSTIDADTITVQAVFPDGSKTGVIGLILYVPEE